MMEMPQRQFYATNIASAVVWAPLHIVPAALLGASIWQGDIKVMAVAGLLILVMAVAIYRVHVFLRRSEQLEPAPKTSPFATIASPPPRSKEARNGTA
jgi:membrane protein DedA with SNARE-associated domain